MVQEIGWTYRGGFLSKDSMPMGVQSINFAYGFFLESKSFQPWSEYYEMLSSDGGRFKCGSR